MTISSFNYQKQRSWPKTTAGACRCEWTAYRSSLSHILFCGITLGQSVWLFRQLCQFQEYFALQNNLGAISVAVGTIMSILERSSCHLIFHSGSPRINPSFHLVPYVDYPVPSQISSMSILACIWLHLTRQTRSIFWLLWIYDSHESLPTCWLTNTSLSAPDYHHQPPT